MTSDGCSYHGDRVVVTVPLAVLKKGMIEFSPPLPEKKVQAIHMLGAGQVEKVCISPFVTYYVWSRQVNNTAVIVVITVIIIIIIIFI